MYSGPELPRDKVAIVKTSDTSVGIAIVDGKKVGRVARMIVKPGKHILEIDLYRRSGGARSVIGTVMPSLAR